MIKNYQKIYNYNKEANKNDQYYSKILSHPISIFIVALVEKTFIKPNHLTLISFFSSVLGAYFIAFHDALLGLIWGWLCIHFALVFDSADGQLARWKNLKSDFGAYLDILTDQIQHRLIIISITFRLYEANEKYWLLGIVVLAIETLSGHENMIQKNLRLKDNNFQQKRDKIATKTFGGGKLKKIIGIIQDNLSGYYLSLMIFFLLNKPDFFLYFIGSLQLIFILKRAFVFSLMEKK